MANKSPQLPKSIIFFFTQIRVTVNGKEQIGHSYIASDSENGYNFLEVKQAIIKNFKTLTQQFQFQEFILRNN